MSHKSVTFGIDVPNTAQIDCNNAHVGLTNKLNDWYKSENNLPFPFTGKCQRSSYLVTILKVGKSVIVHAVIKPLHLSDIIVSY